jgi:DNA polymerase/3'-5' exonuclease PolX
MVGSSSTHIIETCGSYRRGKDFCGDIDIIIARKDGTFEKDLIFNLY